MDETNPTQQPGQKMDSSSYIMQKKYLFIGILVAVVIGLLAIFVF